MLSPHHHHLPLQDLRNAQVDEDVADAGKMHKLVTVLQLITALYSGQMADDDNHIIELEAKLETAGGGGMSTEEEAQYVREISGQKDKIARMAEDLAKATREGAEDRKAVEQIKAKVAQRDKEIEDLRKDLDQAHAIAGTGSAQADEGVVESAKDGALKTGAERRLDALNDAVRNRDREIERLVTDLELARTDSGNKEIETRELHSAVAELTEEVINLTGALESARDETNDLREAGDRNAGLELEVQQLTTKCTMFEAEREDGLGSDRSFFHKMQDVVQKLEGQLRDTVGEKDKKIHALQREIDLLNDEIDAQGEDRIEKMQLELDGKDSQIIALTNQLEEHRQDLEEQDRDFLRIKEDEAHLPDYNNPIVLRERLKMEKDARHIAEKDKFDWEKKYLECKQAMQRYEDDTPGVREFAVAVEDLKDQLDARDAEVVEKAKEANDIQRELEMISERCQCGNQTEAEKEEFQHRRTEQIAVLQAEHDESRRDNNRLESERLLLKKRIHQYVVVHGKMLAGTDGLNPIEEEAIAAMEAEHLALTHKPVAGELPTMVNKQNAPARQSYQAHVQAVPDELKRMLDEVKVQLAANAASSSAFTNDTTSQRNVQVGAEGEAATGIAEGTHMGGANATLARTTGEVDRLRADAAQRELILNEQLALARSEAERKGFDLSTLQNELAQVKASYVEKLEVPYLRLPDRMNPTSADVIANLNEHLIEVLHELTQKDGSIKMLEAVLVDSRRSYAVLAQKQSLWYIEHKETTDELKAAKEAADEQVQKLVGELAQAKVYETEFAAWRENHPDTDVREISRKNVVLKVNQAALTRRYTILTDEKDQLVKDVSKKTSDVAAMNRAVQQRFAYLQSYKEAAEYRIATMQEQLLNVEPKSEFEKEVRRASQLAMKLRSFLDQQSRDIEHGVNAENLRHKGHLMAKENADLRKKLEFSEGNLKNVTGMLKGENGGSRAPILGAERVDGVGTTANPDDAVKGIVDGMQALELTNLKQQNALLEMQLDREISFAKELKARNEEVQRDFQKATHLRLSLEAAELELREQLADCVKRDKYVDLETRFTEERERLAQVETEANHLRQTAETAVRQTRDWQSLQKSQVRELTSLRERLLDMEVESDERTTIGKLHRTILALQTSENDAVRRIEEERQQRLETAARLLKLEQQLDDRNATLRRVRMDAKSTHAHLQSKLHNTRRMYAGAVTLEQQERQLTTLQTAREQKAAAELELESAREKNDEASDQLATLRVEYAELQELLRVTKDGKGAVKLADWHQKMVEARVAELQVSRKLTRELDRTKYLETLVAEAEARLTTCQVEVVIVREDCEHRQMQWEDRETHLEEKIEEQEKLETRRELEIKQVLADFGSGIMWAPDPSKTMPEQLENAIHNLREVAQGLVREKMARQAADDDLSDVRSEAGLLEADKLRLESMVTDLRLQYHEGLPVGSAEDEHRERIETDKAALRVAEESISSLRTLCAQKDTAAAKSRNLLSESNQEAFRMRERHAEELKAMTDRLNRLETLSTEMRSRKENAGSVSGAETSQGHKKIDEMMVELTALRAQNSRKDQELRSHKVSTFSLQTELSNQKEQLVRENGKLRDSRDEFELTVRRMQVEIATLEERLANTDLQQDSLKGQVMNEEEKNSMLKEKQSELEIIIGKKNALIEKRDATIKKLKSEITRSGLKTSLGFGSRAEVRSTARPPTGGGSSGGGGGGAADFEDALGMGASELQERLAKLNANTNKAQAVIKKQKEKYAESEAVRRRLEGDLTKALELVRKHEDELTQAQAKLKEVRLQGLNSVAELALKDNQIEDLEADSKLFRDRSRAMAQHSSQSDADESMIAQLQKRIRILESRGRDAPGPADGRLGGGRGGAGSGGGGPQTMEEKVAAWEVEKRRRKELEGLENKVRELTVGMDAANHELEKRRVRIEDLAAAAGTERESILAGVRVEHHDLDKKRKKQLTTLKAKVAEQAKELAAASEQVKQVRETASRLDREKNQLHRKLLSATKQAPPAGGPAETHRLRGWQEVESVREDLLEAQRRQLATEAELKMLRLERDQLADRLKPDGGMSSTSGGADAAVDQMRSQMDAEQKKRLGSENDNVALRFELEQARTESARAKARLAASGAGGGVDDATSATGSTSSGGGVSNVKYMELVKANKKMKTELADARAPGEAAALAKLAAEHDKMVARLKKELDVVEKTKRKLAESERECQLLVEEKTLREAEHLRSSHHGATSPHSPIRHTSHNPPSSDETNRLAAANDALKRRLAEAENQVESVAAVVEEVERLRTANRELNSELAAFDPSFFEEIEQLKFEHQTLVGENAQLKAELAQH
jgi:centrosomal protein CEP290